MNKIFIDCGANKGQSINLFLKEWKDAKEYKIRSFEANIDFLKPLKDVEKKYNTQGYDIEVNIPVAVWDKDTQNKLFFFGGSQSGVVSEQREAILHRGTVNTIPRKFKPTSIRLSDWIFKNCTLDDYVILKLDIEGSEYRIIKDLFITKAFSYINEFYYEWHGPKKGYIYIDDMKALERIHHWDITPYIWNGNWDKMYLKEVNKELIDGWYKRKGWENEIK